jgi:dihydroxy-acid dehydratase
MTRRGPLPADLITQASINNALTVLQALGGSTNALIHLAAIAGRRGITIDLGAFDRIGREVPVLVDMKPVGQYYMEHFHHGGGMPRLLREIARYPTCQRQYHCGTLADYIAAATTSRTGRNPLASPTVERDRRTAVLHGISPRAR